MNLPEGKLPMLGSSFLEVNEDSEEKFFQAKASGACRSLAERGFAAHNMWRCLAQQKWGRTLCGYIHLRSTHVAHTHTHIHTYIYIYIHKMMFIKKTQIVI